MSLVLVILYYHGKWGIVFENEIRKWKNNEREGSIPQPTSNQRSESEAEINYKDL